MNQDYQEKKSFLQFLKSNKNIFIAISVIFISILMVFSWFEFNNATKKKGASEEFIQAKIMLSNNDNKKATQILKKIVKSKDETYSPLSLFLIIDKNLEIEEKKVEELFDFILTINSLDDEDKNLIKLKKAIYISDKSDEKNVLELLNPIINSDSVWKEQSVKFLGDYYFSLNEFQKAKQYYLTIVNEFEDNTFSKEAKRKLQLIKND
tara:strand:+ start:84 stop:707 length:624 start_codon:yes stop_codon:yes gene_type:complete